MVVVEECLVAGGMQDMPAMWLCDGGGGVGVVECRFADRAFLPDLAALVVVVGWLWVVVLVEVVEGVLLLLLLWKMRWTVKLVGSW